MTQTFQNLIVGNTELFERYVGKTVVSFSKADYMIGEKENHDHFGPLQLEFANGSFLVIDEDGDAESITFKTTPLFFGTTSEVEKKYWTHICLNDGEIWKSFVGLWLSGVDFLVDHFKEREWVCGCRLHFNNQRTITYYNYADNAKVSLDNDELLNSFIEYNSLRWTHVNVGEHVVIKL